MLSYRRVVGQLSRIRRHAHANNLNDPFNRIDFVSAGCLNYSTKSKKPTKSGKTATVEECIPKGKSFKRVPPLPMPPPPPAPHATGPPQGTTLSDDQPRCEDRTYSCPPNCPPSYSEPCYIPGQGPPNDKGPDYGKYLKQLVAALIVAGVSAYAYVKLVVNKPEEELLILSGPKAIKVPANSKDIPKEVPYLLIGGGTAAFSAFRAIKASDPTAKVLVLSKEGDFPYMRPPLSKELWYNKESVPSPKLIFRQWNGSKRSLFYEPPEFYINPKELLESENGGVAICRGWSVSKIDAINQTVSLDDGSTIIKYEKCLIATGAKPKNLEMFTKTKNDKIRDKVIAFRTKDDFLKLKENVQKSEVKDIVVIGGGFLGSEIASSLARNRTSPCQNVIQIYKEKYILAQVLPEYLSEWTTTHSAAEGVRCMPNLEVHDCTMKDNRLLLTLSDGQQIPADQVVVAIGVEPNTAFAKSSDLEIDSELGGLLVNAELEARTNLWAAGDVACFYDVKLGRRRIEHHDHAVVSGRLAGENMTGAAKPYLHQSMFWSDLGPEVGFEAIGIIDSNLETVGVFAKSDDEDSATAELLSSDESIRSTKQMVLREADNENVNDNSAVKAVVKSGSQLKEVSETASSESSDKKLENYEKGIVFYLKDNVVVGIVLWNIFNRMFLARQLLKRGTKYEELNEAAKLFTIHDD